MGKFGDFLKNAGGTIANGVLNGLSGGIGGLISGGLDQLFGGGEPSMRDQINAQKEMADYQFTLNEKAAESAFERNMKMYQRNYEDQSYKAMRKQMEDAGLSIGLMYGGSGSGGGGGAVTGSPQGGITGGLALPSAAAFTQAEAAKQRIAIDAGLAISQTELNKAKANEANANANEATSNAGLLGAKTVTENTMREWNRRIALENAKAKWMENIVYSMRNQAEGRPIEIYGDKNFGTFVPSEYSIEYKTSLAEYAALQAEKGVSESMAKHYDALAKLNDEQANGYFFELIAEYIELGLKAEHNQIEWKNTESKSKEAEAAWKQATEAEKRNIIWDKFAENDKIKADAEALAKKWQTGEYTNWKTWVNEAKDWASLYLDFKRNRDNNKNAREKIGAQVLPLLLRMSK